MKATCNLCCVFIHGFSPLTTAIPFSLSCSAVITKCWHAFCRDCIQTRLDNRDRKCPACSQQFDYQSVKDLYLTS